MYERLPEKIRRRLSIADVLSHYGYSVGRNGRAPCPLHRGKNLNFSYNRDVFHCFVCEENGDIFSLVMKMFGIPFKESVVKLNHDFFLGLSERKPTRREQALMNLNRRINDHIDEQIQRERKVLDGMRIFHRILFQRRCDGTSQDFEDAMQKKIEIYLDDNCEGVIYPWE